MHQAGLEAARPRREPLSTFRRGPSIWSARAVHDVPPWAGEASVCPQPGATGRVRMSRPIDIGAHASDGRRRPHPSQWRAGRESTSSSAEAIQSPPPTSHLTPEPSDPLSSSRVPENQSYRPREAPRENDHSTVRRTPLGSTTAHLSLDSREEHASGRWRCEPISRGAALTRRTRSRPPDGSAAGGRVEPAGRAPARGGPPPRRSSGPRRARSSRLHTGSVEDRHPRSSTSAPPKGSRTNDSSVA